MASATLSVVPFTIFLLAKKLPNYLFTIVGINKIELLNETYIPPNILLLPSQAPENLKKIYGKELINLILSYL